MKNESNEVIEVDLTKRMNHQLSPKAMKQLDAYYTERKKVSSDPRIQELRDEATKIRQQGIAIYNQHLKLADDMDQVCETLIGAMLEVELPTMSIPFRADDPVDADVINERIAEIKKDIASGKITSGAEIPLFTTRHL